MSSDESAPKAPANRRATVACTFCRQREREKKPWKRKCNGQRPVCVNCASSNVECHYTDVEQRRFDAEASLAAIACQILILELQQLPTSHKPTVQFSCCLFSISAWLWCVCSTNSKRDIGSIKGHRFGIRRRTSSNDYSTVAFDNYRISAILPLVRSLLGDYPSDVFLHIKERRKLPSQLKTAFHPGIAPDIPFIDRAITDTLIETYFQSVNLQHPILSYDDFIAHYHSFVSEPLQVSLESCLLLVTLALAEAATTQPPEQLKADWSPGSIYILTAWTIALDAYLNGAVTSAALPRCLYLTALYYNYLSRPLDAWKLVHMASTSFQRLWIRSKPSPEMNDPETQSSIRLCWAIFSVECDLIAEHHLPRSGIENLVDGLCLPLCGDPLDPSLPAWLAELSSRRLLNRVHHAMYAEDHQYLLQADYVTNHGNGGHVEENINRLMSTSVNVSLELDAQLSNWYDLIPQVIKPSLTPSGISIQETILVLRYYSAKDIIFRPFLLSSCSFPSTIQPPHHLLEISQTAAISASTVIATIAALNPWLAESVPDIDALQELAISAIQRWAFPGSYES
ncbi:hypothetical protein N7493_003754 [Penicillium malachiteum]|uniref:Zn(2)-C6 fungal-type domain-containing protein n=1 Tax=Penicillium malachiteum TaxID=1324776 RepID=A0AAD6MXX3_9EURO|nr:hypothetical protein N7493_003754 [Penicillium malachiteum]